MEYLLYFYAGSLHQMSRYIRCCVEIVVHSLYLIRCGGETCSLLLDLFQLHFFSSPYEPQPMVDLEAVDMQRDSRSKIMRLAIVLFLINMIVQCSFLSLREKLSFLTVLELLSAPLV